MNIWFVSNITETVYSTHFHDYNYQRQKVKRVRNDFSGHSVCIRVYISKVFLNINSLDDKAYNPFRRRSKIRRNYALSYSNNIWKNTLKTKWKIFQLLNEFHNRSKIVFNVITCNNLNLVIFKMSQIFWTMYRKCILLYKTLILTFNINQEKI